MHRTQLVALCIGITAIIILGMVAAQWTSSVTAGVSCQGDDLLSLPPENLEYCAKAKWDQHEAAIQATITAGRLTPVATSLPIPAAEARRANIEQDATATAVAKLPTVYQVSKNSMADVFALRGATSIWFIGAVSNELGDGAGLYLYTFAGTLGQKATLGVAIVGNLTKEEHQKYDRKWESPLKGDDLTIEAVTARDGVATVSSPAGDKATFNLACQTWSVVP